MLNLPHWIWQIEQIISQAGAEVSDKTDNEFWQHETLQSNFHGY